MKMRLQRQIDRFMMNNCKVANELRKYRDLAGCLNQASLSGEQGRRPTDAKDYVEYFISRDLTYLDMVTANAAYTLMINSQPQEGFTADVIARIMAGSMDRRIDKHRRQRLEEQLCALADTQIYILADHDSQVIRDLYAGKFLPLSWEEQGGKRWFHFRPGEEMPLYQYASDHRQIIEVPFPRLRDSQGQTRHNNNERTLLLRHYLLQELEILLYEHNRVETLRIRLLKRDREGNEFGLLWSLGLLEEGSATDAVARGVLKRMEELLEGWKADGWLEKLRYEIVPEGKDMGVRFFSEAETQK